MPTLVRLLVTTVEFNVDPVNVPAAVGVTKINELAVTVVLFIKTEPAVKTSDPTLVLEPEGISSEPVTVRLFVKLPDPDTVNEPVIFTALEEDILNTEDPLYVRSNKCLEPVPE